MKFAINRDQRRYFEVNQCLELEGILTPSEVVKVYSAARNATAAKMRINPREIEQQAPAVVWKEAWDLWRSDETLHKNATSLRLAELVRELIEVKPLRLVYDHYLFGQDSLGKGASLLQKDSSFPLLQKTHTLDELSCAFPLVGAVLICLTPPRVPSEIDSLFPQVAGNAVILHPQKAIDFAALSRLAGASYCLIAYSAQLAQYKLNEADLHTHAWKRLGYVFGDRLSDRYHPIVYR